MSTWSRTTRVVAVAGGLVLLTASGAGLAWAATTTSTTSPAAGGSQAVRLHTVVGAADKRFGAAEKRMTSLRARVDQAAALTPDRARLDQEIDGLLAAVKAAQAKVDGATTPTRARTALREAQPLLAQGRVIVRQVRQLRVADAAASSVAKAQIRVTALSARVSTLPADSPVRSALTDLTSRLQDAAQKAAAVLAADRALSVSNPAAANPVLAENAKALQALQADRRKIAADRQTILAGLRAANATKKSTPTG